MEFLEHIDFYNQDGVFLPMLNDVNRNKFYDMILSEVKEKYCIEIGFGTGLLSVLALKHGARHIVAYESDTNRYQLGKTVIEFLGLKEKITLLNKTYDHKCDSDAEVIFTETVDRNIWGEGIYQNLPRTGHQRFLPGQYFLEIYCVTVTEDVAIKFIKSQEEHYFNPGIDLDPKFVGFVNLVLSKKYNKSIQSKTKLPVGITVLPRNQNLLGLTNNDTWATMYTIDANGPFADIDQRELFVETQNQPVLIIPRAGLQHHGVRLYLDSGHWGMTDYSVVVNQPYSKVSISHDLRTGNITYTIKEQQ